MVAVQKRAGEQKARRLAEKDLRTCGAHVPFSN